MDFREKRLDAADFAQLGEFIRQRKLSYQPFRFDADHEVGEGMAFLAATSAGFRKGVVHWPELPDEVAHLLVQPAELEIFRSANDALRTIYDHFITSLSRHLGDDLVGLDFAEFGCNTGYFPYSLSLRGARRAIGLDFTHNWAVFDFINRILGTDATFLFSEWDSFRHEPHYNAVPEVDVCLSIAVLCHLADPLHHLTYLCSRARRAVMVWTPSHKSGDLFMSFGQPALFPNSLAWPLSFDNLVKPSSSLLELCLRQSGFEDIRYIEPVATPFDEIAFWEHHTGIVAFRTRDARTVYSGGAVRRAAPPEVAAEARAEAGETLTSKQTEPPRLVQTVDQYNIVQFEERWCAIPSGVAADLERDEPASIPGLLMADNLAGLIQIVSAHPLPPAPPRQVSTVGRFNIVQFKNLWYALPFGQVVDWAADDVPQLPGVLTGTTQDQVTTAVMAIGTPPE